MNRPSIVAALVLAVACQPDDTTPPEPVGAAAQAQPSPSDLVIDPERMFASLEHLAADEMGGRYTRTEGDLGRAANYLAEEYRKVSLAPVTESFRAPFQLPVGSEPGPEVHFWVETSGAVIEVPTEHYATLANGGGKPVFGDVTRVGNAAPKSVRDTVALIEVPGLSGLASRAEDLAKAGAMAVVAVVPEVPAKTEQLAAKLPVVIVAASEAAAWLPDSIKSGKRFEDLQFSLAAEPVPVHEPSFNVLAWIPGTERPDEVVILGAHYDHIGTRDHGSFCRPSPGEDESDQICNGADDNASGTAMVLEIARTLAQAGYQPKRSLVFAHFAGEELGLHGSYGLANEPPRAAPFDEGKVVAMINLDMVGRYRDQEGLQIGGVSSSDAWHPLIEAAGDQDLTLLFERSVTGRSDHIHWYRQHVPVLFFFTGLHRDYHRAGDHADKINREGMASIAKIVTHVLVEVANGADVTWAEPRSGAEGEVRRLPGSDPKTVDP